jgi:gamma-glutamyl-gamma-aminobutyraldehyde dehydrogenase
MTAEQEDWIDRRERLNIDGRALVGGERKDLEDGRSAVLLSPRDGEPLARVAHASHVDVDAAVRFSAAAQTEWAARPGAQRRGVLHAWADAVEQDALDIALVLSLEVGKPVRAALEVEVRSLLRSIRWYADVADKLQGYHPDTGESSVAFVRRDPVGVVGVVLPWNFPLSMVGFDVAPALAAGNGVVVKPSPKAPLAVLMVVDAATAAGLPPGLVNVCPDAGFEAGAVLGRHPRVDVISVTGSESAGRAFFSYAAEGTPKRIWPKLGGKSFVGVAADAPSLARAAEAIAWGAYFNAGAMCTGAARIFVESPVYDEFCTLLVDEVEKLVTGDPLEWRTDVGALVDRMTLDATRSAVALAIEGSAHLLAGTGEADHDVNLGGAYMQPCLLADVTFDHPIFRTELFGPVATITKCADISEAIDHANRSGFGMAVSLWTGSLQKSLLGSKAVKAGMVWINCFEGDDLSVPFGGVRRSGFGRDKSMMAIEKYTDLKTTWIQLDDVSYW